MRAASRLVGCSIALNLVLIAGTASAQIAPPPGEAPPPTPEYVPQPEAPKAPAALPTPNPAPVRREPNTQVNYAEDMRAAETIIFDTIVKRTPDGRIVPLSEPVEYVVIRENPLLKDAPVTQARIEPVLRERRAKIENLVIENFDIMNRLEAGAIENLDLSDRARLGELSAMVKPFTELGTLNSELRRQRIIGKVPSGVSQRMIKDWTSQNMAQLRADVRTEGGLDPEVNPATAGQDAGAGKSAANNPAVRAELGAMTKFMISQAVAEPMYLYRQILMDVATHADEVLGSAGVDAKAIADIKSAPESERASMVSAALGGLERDKARDAMRKAVALRPPLPPLPDVEKIKAEYMGRVGKAERPGQLPPGEDLGQINQVPADQPSGQETKPAGEPSATQPK